MTSRKKIDELIYAGKIREIFTRRLGWDNADEPSISADGGESGIVEIIPVVEKCNFVVWAAKCKSIPQKQSRLKLQKQLSKRHHEHLLVLLGDSGDQIWMAVVKQPCKKDRVVEVSISPGRSTNALLEKLDSIGFSIEENDDLTLSGVSNRVEAAFALHAQKITREFYEKFKQELKNFQGFVRGLQSRADRDQYAALMLNRLMFIYFIQSKRFLDNNPRYLQERLKKYKEESVQGKSFYKGFYRHFLMTLFHQGLGSSGEQLDKAQRDEVRRKIGKVPYLNGGLFDKHQLEEDHKADLDIEDAAFDRIFVFFDKYEWRLDSRATASGKEINPDVIGYIFEKYINDRAAKGAYYTQEDITGYIARNAILPHLLRQTKKECPAMFHPKTGGVWKMLRKNPDRYIRDAMGRGCLLQDSDLPEDIRTGMDEHAPDLLKRRAKWNTPAAEEWALPTETWRDTLTRRARFAALKAKLQSGEVSDIADLTTHNLDIEKLTIHALRDSKDADFITAFYTALAGYQDKGECSSTKSKRGISVLDPACGSGAFLFAALNVLQPLYSQCIARIRGFVADDNAHGKNDKQGKDAELYKRFRDVLGEMDSHPSEEYGIYRSIILGNLFGVDIMSEAIEVAKLRLFLKLAAVAEMDKNKPNMGLEPLPDIDFNIRAGNSLVGFANSDDFREKASTMLELIGGASEIHERLESVGTAYHHFVKLQTTMSITAKEFKQKKEILSSMLKELNGLLNKYLAADYGVPYHKATGFDDERLARWQHSHKPFHWLSEFYSIVEHGGFDVVIGNPPYVKYNFVLKRTYTIKGYRTESCGDLYAFFIERAKLLASNNAPISMIIPVSGVSNDGMSRLVREIVENATVHISSYGDRPSKLFQDTEQSLTIFVRHPGNGGVFTSSFNRWAVGYRPHLFDTLEYTKSGSMIHPPIRKIKSVIEAGIIDKLFVSRVGAMRIGDPLGGVPLRNYLSAKSKGAGKTVYYYNTPRYWIRATNFVPYFWNERDGEKQSTQIIPLFVNDGSAPSLCALMNSSLFYWWFAIMSDCRHLNSREVVNFPFPLEFFHRDHGKKIAPLIARLMKDYRKNSVRKEMQYKTTGKVVIDGFYPRFSKHIFDEIDKILAEHYRFTEVELDYIINYNYKYRMGGADE